MSRMIRRFLFWGAMFLCLLTIAYGVWLRFDGAKQPAVDPSLLQTAPSATPVVPTPTQPPRPTPTATASAPIADCSAGSGLFVPTSVMVVGQTVAVVAVPREGGTPGTPPLTSVGKRQMAWDEPGVRPGVEQGNVLLNAHTWPDGSALGNDLLKQLHEGDRIVLRGDSGRQICYQVNQRLQVPVADYPQQRVYNPDGPSGLVITVCSGLRLGPGDWADRTLWFATPIE